MLTKDLTKLTKAELIALLEESGKGTQDEGDEQHTVLELANKAASCIPELRAKYGAADFDDYHPSISPVIRSFVMKLNDKLPAEVRTKLLKPFVLKILGTNTTLEDEWKRGWMITDWVYRGYTPIWLRAAGLIKEAKALETLPEVVDTTTAQSTRSAVYAAWDAAWDAARDASSTATWGAAKVGSRDDAWEAAKVATKVTEENTVGAALKSTTYAAWYDVLADVEDTAWAVAWKSVRGAAQPAAEKAVRIVWDAAIAAGSVWTNARYGESTVYDAVLAAEVEATQATGLATWAAARAAAHIVGAAAGLTPHDKRIQVVGKVRESSIDLLDKMCAVGRE